MTMNEYEHDDAGDDIVMNDSRCRGLGEFGTKRNAGNDYNVDFAKPEAFSCPSK